jgi:hypothetical protein
MVSVNGTVGDLIGPVSATARPSIEKMLEILSGQISATQLAQDLATPFGTIGQLRSDIDDEILNRNTAISSMQTAIASLEGDTVASVAQVRNDIDTYRTEVSAYASDISTLLVGTNAGDSLVSIIDAKVAEVNAGDGVTLAEVTQQIQSSQQNIYGTTDEAAIATRLNTFIDETGVASAGYTTVSEVNGLLGGFGIYNDGETVTTIFDADRFAVGRREGTDVVDHKFTMYELLSHTGAVDTGTKVYLDNYAPISIGTYSPGSITVRMPNYYLPQGKRWRAVVASTSIAGGLDRYFDYSMIHGDADHEPVIFSPTPDGQWIEATITSARLLSEFSQCYVVIGTGGLTIGDGSTSNVSMWETISAHITSANGSQSLTPHTQKPQILTSLKDGIITFAASTVFSAEVAHLTDKFGFTDVSPQTPFKFIVDETGVWMDNAFIKDLDAAAITTGTLDASVKVTAPSISIEDGGDLNVGGKFIVDHLGNVTIKTATTNTSRLEMTNDVIKIFNGSETHPRVKLGNLDA